MTTLAGCVVALALLFGALPASAQAAGYDGDYTGDWSGTLCGSKYYGCQSGGGPLTFTVSGGVITSGSTGSGPFTGAVDASGNGSGSGSAIVNGYHVSCNWNGPFALGADGRVTLAANLTGCHDNDGFGFTGDGKANASRPAPPPTPGGGTSGGGSNEICAGDSHHFHDLEALSLGQATSKLAEWHCKLAKVTWKYCDQYRKEESKPTGNCYRYHKGTVLSWDFPPGDDLGGTVSLLLSLGPKKPAQAKKPCADKKGKARKQCLKKHRGKKRPCHGPGAVGRGCNQRHRRPGRGRH
jgi:hypothetical protein